MMEKETQLNKFIEKLKATAGIMEENLNLYLCLITIKY